MILNKAITCKGKNAQTYYRVMLRYKHFGYSYYAARREALGYIRGDWTFSL